MLLQHRFRAFAVMSLHLHFFCRTKKMQVTYCHAVSLKFLRMEFEKRVFFCIFVYGKRTKCALTHAFYLV